MQMSLQGRTILLPRAQNRAIPSQQMQNKAHMRPEGNAWNCAGCANREETTPLVTFLQILVQNSIALMLTHAREQSHNARTPKARIGHFIHSRKERAWQGREELSCKEWIQICQDADKLPGTNERGQARGGMVTLQRADPNLSGC